MYIKEERLIEKIKNDEIQDNQQFEVKTIQTDTKIYTYDRKNKKLCLNNEIWLSLDYKRDGLKRIIKQL